VITILHLITDLEIGGAEAMLAKLLKAMDPSRYRNVVVSLTGRGRLADSIEAAGVPIHSLEMKRARIDLTVLPKLVRLVKQIRPAVLQTWLYHADLLGTAAAILGHCPQLAWNVRCSDMVLAHYPWTTRVTLKMLALCSRIPQTIIVNSHAGQRFHQEIGYRARRWHVIPNGFDVEEFRPDQGAYLRWRDKLGLSHDTMLIGMVARMDPMKDHVTFLKAARQIASSRNDVAFVLVGKGVESLASQVSMLGLTGKVHLLGIRADVAGIMPALDIFSLTSAFGEGFPNVVGEAMACGVPCVVTDVGDAGFLVGDTGRAVPPKNPELLAGQWLEVISMGRARRLEMGAASRERIKARFNLHSVVSQYQRCYEELAGQSVAAG
jgi:glycosyltransferase involved in cell wall biosynthesis